MAAVANPAPSASSTGILLNSGAYPNAADCDGATALMEAARNDQGQGHNVSQLLLDAGAEISAVDTSDSTALMIASKNPQTGPSTITMIPMDPDHDSKREAKTGELVSRRLCEGSKKIISVLLSGNVSEQTRNDALAMVVSRPEPDVGLLEIFSLECVHDEAHLPIRQQA